MDDLGLVEAIDRFREGIVVAIADAADRRLDACFREALGILDRDVLAASVAVMHEPALYRPGAGACRVRICQTAWRASKLAACSYELIGQTRRRLLFRDAHRIEHQCLPVARNGPTGPVWRCPFIGVARKWLAEGRNDAIRDTGKIVRETWIA